MCAPNSSHEARPHRAAVEVAVVVAEVGVDGVLAELHRPTAARIARACSGGDVAARVLQPARRARDRQHRAEARARGACRCCTRRRRRCSARRARCGRRRRGSGACTSAITSSTSCSPIQRHITCPKPSGATTIQLGRPARLELVPEVLRRTPSSSCCCRARRPGTGCRWPSRRAARSAAGRRAPGRSSAARRCA